MKTINPAIVVASLVMSSAMAQSSAPLSGPAPAVSAGVAAEKMDAKAIAAAAAEAEANRMRFDFSGGDRTITAYFPKSQARIKVFAVTRFDADLAKPREYFLLSMTGAGIVEPVVLDVDDPASRANLVSILERFHSEAAKSNKLKENMAKRKVAAGEELSREETKLLDLQSAPSPDADAISKSKSRIVELKEVVTLAEDLGKMPKISGPIGHAKLHLDRPAYDFVASMEPIKALYTLQAGYSFQVSDKDVKFYVDLLNEAPELKRRLLENEARQLKLKNEVGEFFKSK